MNFTYDEKDPDALIYLPFNKYPIKPPRIDVNRRSNDYGNLKEDP